MRVVELNFIWGNMMTNLGDSTSGNSEKLFQRDRGKRQYICDFGKGGVHAIKHKHFGESFC